jgi:hypothetical protein
MKPNLQHRKRIVKRGSALAASIFVLSLLAVASVSYLEQSTESLRLTRRLTNEVSTTNLCEGGIQDVLHSLWRPFKQEQNFEDLDADLDGASPNNPKKPIAGQVLGAGSYSAGVIGFSTPPGDNFSRNITIRAIGWIDRDSDGVLDSGEVSKSIDVTARFELTRSKVFDYAYFVNNYGWMTGFNQNDLVVNGDMRANGNFNFLSGSPTVNGSVFATGNDKLVPRAVGLINAPPIKMTTSQYASWQPAAPSRISGESNAAFATRTAAYRTMISQRRRPAHNSGLHGADGSDDYEKNRDLVFRSEATIVRDRPAGSILGDSTGYRSWANTSGTASATVLDTQPTKEVAMPDLSDLTRYTSISQNYRNPKATFGDGTANPNFNQGARVEVWNPATSTYQRLDTNGVITGSAILVGTPGKPIKIHGPVTVTQDVVIKGDIEGQGTFYTGRNIHIVGSVRYKNGPDFSGGNMQRSDEENEKRDFLGLAARGSVIMGNPVTFTSSWPLQFMTPVNPPSKNVGTYGRFDDAGNWIPPYDANQIDSSGRRRYQSVIPDATMNSIAEGVNQIDAIIYTNFVGGGNIGTAGGGVVMNGTIISRDEAMVTWSLPVIMNYDNRIRERSVTRTPLIDLNLPRSPVMMRSTWQDRGITYGIYEECED